MKRAIIIDDEPSAVSLLTNMLQKFCSQWIRVIGTGNDAEEGRCLIQSLRPDIVFLDIQMPGCNGIELARSLGTDSCHIIFVTAYDHYAIEAFRVNAIDYLLKPVDAAELQRVVQKLVEKMQRVEHTEDLQWKKLEQLFTTRQHDSRIGIMMADKVVFIPVQEIIYCEASGPYTHIYTSENKKLVTCKSLGEFEDQLKDHQFFRIHHSYLINLKKLREFKKNDGGYVVMDNNARLEIAQRRRAAFLDIIATVTL